MHGYTVGELDCLPKVCRKFNYNDNIPGGSYQFIKCANVFSYIYSQSKSA